MRTISSLAIAATLAAAPATARDWPRAGGWEIAEDGAVDCRVRHDMAEDRSFWLFLRTDGTFRFHVLGFEPGTEQDYSLGVDGRRWKHSDDLGPAEMEAMFASLANGRHLELYGKTGIVDRVALGDAGAAITGLRSCAAALEAQLASELASGKLVLQPRPTQLARFPKPDVRAKATLADLFGPERYPTWEVAEGNEGTTGFRTEIKPDGRVGNCTITLSSGSEALDIAACRIMQTRARFTPARDASGNAVTDVQNRRIHWAIARPTDAEAPPEPSVDDEPDERTSGD